MAKSVYQIRAALDRSYLDHEIVLPLGGFEVPPMPIKQLLFYAGGAVFTLWCVTSTFIGGAGIMMKVLVVVWMLLVIAYLGTLTKTKELRLMQLPALFAYLPHRARHVMTRRSSNPTELHAIIGIDRVDADGGIHFADGSVGQMYSVVGSASYLLFDEDRDAILDRVDGFWQKAQTTAEWLFITTQEPQRIHHQVASLERRNQDLELRDPDLLELQNEAYDILTEHVGGKFPSIHQRVLIKAKSPDALKQAHLLLQAEAESASMMFKEAVPLDRDEMLPVLRTFYQGLSVGRAADQALTV